MTARLVFHSLRHTFKTLGHNAKLPEYILDQICGHAPVTEGARYGEGAVLEVVHEEMMRVDFGAISWSQLQKAASAIDWKSVVEAQCSPSRAARKARL